MEAMFITVHDLSLDARIKFCSESIVDVLGYYPSEVKGKSCWEFFHPDEIPLAKSIHVQGLHLDKAAVLNYCQIRHKNGHWVCCECTFTIVYDVLISSTSIYKGGPRPRRRALDAANIKRIFSSCPPKQSPCQMLSAFSNQCTHEPKKHWREPRAALFLNRFSRSSSIMFATKTVSTILGGVSAEQLVGKSFYFCIAEDCLANAVKCVEGAKSNDSIAYLRFWYRDPTLPETQPLSIRHPHHRHADVDDKDDGHRNDQVGASNLARGFCGITTDNKSLSPMRGYPMKRDGGSHNLSSPPMMTVSNSYKHKGLLKSTSTSMSTSTAIEIEAVVLCSSDSLVVVIRRAHPSTCPKRSVKS